MAGERKGKTCEALIKVVLDDLINRHKLIGQVFWNEKAPGMTVTPDFTIGKKVEEPEYVLLIAHSGSAKNSDMKSWRNLGELAECKLRLKTVPKVFSVAFESIVKENLKKVGAAAFDGQLIVGDQRYGKALTKWVDIHHNLLPKDADKKATAIATLVAKKDRTFTPLFANLVADIESLLSSTNPALDSLWKKERSRPVGIAPVARITSVRRGLSKLLIFENLDLALQLYRGGRIPHSAVPQYAFDLHLANRLIGRAGPADPEIAVAMMLLPDAQIKAIITGFDVSKVGAWLKTLRNASHLIFAGKYVTTEYVNLCDPVQLHARLKLLHSDPWALVPASEIPDNWPPEDMWLFSFLLEVVKASSKSSNGYGYAQMEQEAAQLTGMPRAGDPVYRINLPDWVLRRGKLTLSSNVLLGLSKVIATHLQEIGSTSIKEACEKAVKAMADNIIETKLASYRMFDPLRHVIADAVTDLSDVSVIACYAEKAELGGGTAAIQLGKSRSTLINWQSATDEGKGHKVKELCGRAAALRYTWHAKTKSFIPRPGVKKLCLVVDGTWTQVDLDTLVRAGWDEIFYPDEMAKLAKAII